MKVNNPNHYSDLPLSDTLNANQVSDLIGTTIHWYNMVHNYAGVGNLQFAAARSRTASSEMKLNI